MASTGASRRTALITGVAGQDGVYLARHLLSLGYHVVGTLRPGSRWAPTTLGRAYAYLDGVTLVDLDQRDHEGWAAVLEGLRPDEVYNLAGFTSVGASWGAAETVAEANGMAVLRMLEELIRFRDRHGWAPRFFQPSSSEMFGVTDQQPQTENTPHHPRSPYAATKSFARDWGFAGDYARAMHLVLQQDEPGDFIIATGVSRSLADVLELAFASVGISDLDAVVRQDPSLMRPADVAELVGDPAKAREQLGWEPSVAFEDVIAHMVRVDVERLRSEREESAGYLLP